MLFFGVLFWVHGQMLTGQMLTGYMHTRTNAHTDKCSLKKSDFCLDGHYSHQLSKIVRGGGRMILGAILSFEMEGKAVFHAHRLYKYNVYRYSRV